MSAHPFDVEMTTIAAASPLAGAISILGLLAALAYFTWLRPDLDPHSRVVLVVGGLGVR
jgi:hypothetical protein